MGHPERRVRERKRVAAFCRTLGSFLPPAKRNRSTSDSAHSIPATSQYRTGSDCHCTVRYAHPRTISSLEIVRGWGG